MFGRFKQAEHTESSGQWTIILDTHKTTRHHRKVKLTVNGRIYGYLKIYEECIHPNFAAKGEDAVFGKMMASNSHQEQLVGGFPIFSPKLV